MITTLKCHCSNRSSRYFSIIKFLLALAISVLHLSVWMNLKKYFLACEQALYLGLVGDLFLGASSEWPQEDWGGGDRLPLATQNKSRVIIESLRISV